MLARASSSSGSGRLSAAPPARAELERLRHRAGCSTSTCARDSSAPLSSKDGFSVVAPTSVIVPSSMSGRKLSCCERLKRWISSTNSSVPLPCSRRARACSKTFLRSATPEKIAEICSKTKPGLAGKQPRDRRLAGAGRAPQDDVPRTRPLPACRVRTPSGPVRCSWPTTSPELLRPQAVGQRPRRRPGRDLPRLEQIGHRASAAEPQPTDPPAAIDRELPMAVARLIARH